MDLHMLVLGLGKERTAAEFDALLARAGLALRRAMRASGRTGINHRSPLRLKHSPQSLRPVKPLV
jgi:hypothetical protein